MLLIATFRLPPELYNPIDIREVIRSITWKDDHPPADIVDEPPVLEALPGFYFGEIFAVVGSDY
jgi:hypothetical protein